MSRKEFQKKMMVFESDMSNIGTFNGIYILSPIMYIIWFIRHVSKRKIIKKRYTELLSEIDTIIPPLEEKEYIGWKRRITSAYKY